ncbi:MAG: DUF3106 domain-containing protein, partial [Bryobacteraceae bacterium]
MLAAIVPAEAQPRRLDARREGPPPHTLLERLNNMSPEQRERMLRKLPPERRSILERRLENYNRTSPEVKRRLGAEYDNFRQLAPEKQEKARRLFRGLN